MVLKMRERVICCIVATILFFLGISVETTTVDSSFLGTTESASMRSAEHIVNEADVCTPSMLTRGTTSIQRSLTNSVSKWQSRTVLIFLFAGVSLQYLLCYQSAQSKEDGRLFLCRSMIVDYIHLKDSGE